MAVPARRRTKRDIKRVLKDLQTMKRGGKPASRRNPSAVLAQTALAVPRKAFGTRGAKTNSSGMGKARMLMGLLDARIPRSIGLPRAVGPYTIIRVSRLISSSAKVIIFGSFMLEGLGNEPRKWSGWDAIEDVDPAANVNAATNARAWLSPILQLGNVAEVVPASMTVQVMNPSSLQTATGINAMARVNQQLDLADYSETWNNLIGQFLSYYNPRLLSGGKLAIRGVICHSYPLDMTEYSHFTRIRAYGADAGDGTTIVTLGDAIRPAALAPIVFAQGGDTPQSIEFLVTKEYRVRFDPGNPATASHTYHSITSDSDWDACIKMMQACGHGVGELAEDAADVGVLGAAARVASIAAM